MDTRVSGFFVFRVLAAVTPATPLPTITTFRTGDKLSVSHLKKG
jgi:hypothetical protein